jgi:hypothetical protein
MEFHRRLVHCSRPGSAYFVTWRLDGSLPITRVTDFLTSDGPKFVELDQLLDAVSTGPSDQDLATTVKSVKSSSAHAANRSGYTRLPAAFLPNQGQRAA